jgi:hypothetical protein
MSQRRCTKCGYVWEGDLNPFCPMCNVKTWEEYSDFIRPKHDPTKLPYPMEDPRSVVTMDFITNKELYIYTLATTGQYYYDTKYNNFSCVVNQPLGTTAGSAVPSWYPWPTYPLDSQIVVDVIGFPHVYAEDLSTIQRQISRKRLIPPRRCEMVGCTNLAIPGTRRCEMH